jgi:hypothetical protein
MSYASWAAWITLAAVFNARCALTAHRRRHVVWFRFLTSWAVALVALAAVCAAIAVLMPGAVPPVR